MTQKPISLSIFFPTYNEEENIRTTIERTISVAEGSSRVANYEIIVVDDGSTDATAAITDQLAKQHPNVKVIHHVENRGYGAALKTGISAATLDYIFFTDADLQFDILELENLLIHTPQYEFVIGYRAPRRDPFMRLANAAVWNVLNKFLFGLHIRDIDCAFKLFKRELVQDLLLRSNGAMINAEILVRISRSGVPIKQVPVSHLPRLAGSPTGAKFSVIFRALKELVGLYNGELGLVTQKQVMKFMIVGVLNTSIDLIAYVILTRVPAFAVSITIAKLLSFLAGTVSSFVLNRAWTFEVRTKFNILEVVRFYSVTLISLAVNLVVMSFLTQYLGIYDLLALLITTVFTFGVSFTFSKAWVFVKNTNVRAPQIGTGLLAAFIAVNAFSICTPVTHAALLPAVDQGQSSVPTILHIVHTDVSNSYVRTPAPSNTTSPTQSAPSPVLTATTPTVQPTTPTVVPATVTPVLVKTPSAVTKTVPATTSKKNVIATITNAVTATIATRSSPALVQSTASSASQNIYATTTTLPIRDTLALLCLSLALFIIGSTLIRRDSFPPFGTFRIPNPFAQPVAR